ncbi:MAG: FKBP-type peptidyl-prolyl cis-trans isomerase [Bacteroidaceae bacterium]|jgi:FKBP-type peptidyl-prolyl cis-trans isomerase FklB|nr:FKBP-type peptidyl-prolyl cis-trans isomerase [Bacteroidaceae bacterium]
MKKTSIILSALVAGMMAACTSGTPKANLTSDIDTLSYAIGMAQSQGLKDYLSMRMGVDTAYMDAFIKGFNESAKSGEDKKQNAYYAGLQIGQQVSQQMLKSINDDLFGSDSTQTISLDNFMAGFVAGTTGKGGLMTVDSASTVAQTKMQQVKARHMEEVYGDNKKQCEEFMANIAKKEGIKALENGVYYEVLTEGKGEIPSDTSRVKVHYEGRLINDTIFDSSYKRNQPTTFRANMVIPGWTNALTHMPVGSKWKVYIPQDQAYADREMGQIKPFSCLIFTIDLLEIEK